MSILSGIKKVIPYFKNADGNYEQLSYKTSSQTVDFDDGKTAETKLGAIKGITTSTSVTETGYAADAKIVSEINQSLDAVLDITAQKYYSNSKTYLNFYYDKATSYFGIIYNLSSNNINGVRPILFTLRISYDGTQIKFDQINEAPGATLNVNKATNNTYVSFEINQTSDKKNLSYLQLWITQIK